MKNPEPTAVLELLKPITWFAPMWAFACGVVSSGAAVATQWGMIVAGVALAGPLVCATSQAETGATLSVLGMLVSAFALRSGVLEAL